MDTVIKNNQIDYLHKICKYENEVNRTTIFSSTNGSINIIALKRGQNLSTHLAPADAMVQVIEGRLDFKVNEIEQTMEAGQFIMMSKGTPHSLKAVEDTKFVLTLIKP